MPLQKCFCKDWAFVKKVEVGNLVECCSELVHWSLLTIHVTAFSQDEGLKIRNQKNAMKVFLEMNRVVKIALTSSVTLKSFTEHDLTNASPWIQQKIDGKNLQR